MSTALQKLHLISKNKSLFSILPVTPETLELTDHWRQNAYAVVVFFPKNLLSLTI